MTKEIVLERLRLLASSLVDEQKREQVLQKIEELEKQNSKVKKGGDGMLQDTFEFKAKGHVMIESLDEDGKPDKVLLEKDNLVVNKADEIILRAVSGDSGRSIFKNRVPKSEGAIVLVSKNKLNDKGVSDGDKVVHDPSVLWSEADDELFDISFAYYPTVVYIEEITTTEVGKNAFRVYSSLSGSRLPLGSETYSNYTNMFIGLGKGKTLKYEITEETVTTSEGTATIDDGVINLTKEEDTFEIKMKGSRLKVDVEFSDKGGTLDVLLDDKVIKKIETGDKSLLVEEIREIEILFSGNADEKEQTIVFKHVGSTVEIIDPVIKVTGLGTSTLIKNMNNMISEFSNYQTEYETPILVNTTPEEPYTVKVPHHPVKLESMKVDVRGKKFEPVEDIEEIGDEKFFYDEKSGELHFNSASTDISLRYEITGKYAEVKDKGSFTDVVITDVEVEEHEIEAQSISHPGGSNPILNLGKKNIKADTLEVKIAGTIVPVSGVSTLDLSEGTFRLPSYSTGAITASFTYTVTTKTPISVHEAMLEYPVTSDLILYTYQGEELTKAESILEMEQGKFIIDEINPKKIYISKETTLSEPIDFVYLNYLSSEFKGYETNYKRALIDKPKSEGQYPWFQYDTGSIRFVATFPEKDINGNITIREMGLFDGPRQSDNFEGFPNYPVKAFSLITIPDSVKDYSTGIQVTWSITFVNEENAHYKGGNN